MNWTTAFRLATAIISALGGGGVLVFALSSYLGKLWADRALEKEKHKYAEMLQAAKAELDLATNRYQVQLDALGHIHRLRTDEEFLRLGQLWKKLSILQSAFKASAGLGVMLVPADPDERNKFKRALRKEYEDALWAARNFFLEEKLFVPKAIADNAESTLGYAVKEKNFFDLFSDHHETAVRLQYTENLEGFLKGFNEGMETLERLMRVHIQGNS
jgi:hypothetical protein